MILKKLSILHFGAIDLFSCELNDKLNILNFRYCDELIYALRLVLNHKSNPPLYEHFIRAETRIEARVSIGEKEYFTIISPDSANGELTLQAYDASEKEVSTEYLYLSSHPAEQDLTDVFDGNGETMLLRLLQYANEDIYYAPNELATQTEGISRLRAFRVHLRKFIKNFKSETIREGKHYEIVLKPNGRYSVKHTMVFDQPVFLSESEQTLFRYLCFLRTAEFWQGFEEIRNLHGIKKPLIVKDFMNRLDDSIDTKDILQRTGALDRQIIILS